MQHYNPDFAKPKRSSAEPCPGGAAPLRTIPPITTPTTAWADFPAATSSAGEARRFVCTTLEGWDLGRLADAATLLVSELAANAVLHARTAIRVRVRLAATRVRIEVHDGNNRAPARKHYSSMATTGRGLLLVERMSSRWGVEAQGAGKQVWFELDLHVGAEAPAAGAFEDIDLDEFEALGIDAPPPSGADPAGTRRAPRALAGAGAR